MCTRSRAAKYPPFINDYVDIVIAIPKAWSCTRSAAQPVPPVLRGQTIYRAVKAGRLSAYKLTSGTYVIYPGELLRVFPLESSFSKTVAMAKLQGFGFPAWDKLNVFLHARHDGSVRQELATGMRNEPRRR